MTVQHRDGIVAFQQPTWHVRVQMEKMDAATLSRTLVKVSRIASGRSMGSDGLPQINGQATYNTNNTYNTQSSYASQDEQDEVEMLFSKMSPVRTPLLKPPLDTTAHGALQVNLVAVMHACCDLSLIHI